MGEREGLVIEKDVGYDVPTSKTLIALGSDWKQCKIQEVDN